MKRESAVERLFKKEVSKAGGRSYKFVSPNNRGVSDQLVMWPEGIVHFVELKTEVGKMSALQEQFKKECMEMGATHVLVKGDKEVYNYIHEYRHLGKK